MKKTLLALSMVIVSTVIPLSVFSAEKAADVLVSAPVAELSKGEKDTLFIGELKVLPSVLEMAKKKNRLSELKRLSGSLESQFISALSATRVFQLVERSSNVDSEQEQEQVAGTVPPDDKKTARAGRMAGAKFAFLPQIDGFEDKSVTTEYQAIGRASMSRTLFLSAVVQIVDTNTGKLLPDAPSVQLTKTEEIENGRIGHLSGSDEVIVLLAKEMAKKLSQEAVAFLRPAKVLTVTGRQVLINRGSEAGFSLGDLVVIYAVQNVKDEDTGEMYHNEVVVGQAVINRIDTNQSYAAVSGDDMGITKGCVVRFAKSAVRRAVEGESPPDVTLPDFGTKGDGGNTPGSSEKPLKWK